MSDDDDDGWPSFHGFTAGGPFFFLPAVIQRANTRVEKLRPQCVCLRWVSFFPVRLPPTPSCPLPFFWLTRHVRTRLILGRNHLLEGAFKEITCSTHKDLLYNQFPGGIVTPGHKRTAKNVWRWHSFSQSRRSCTISILQSGQVWKCQRRFNHGEHLKFTKTHLWGDENISRSRITHVQTCTSLENISMKIYTYIYNSVGHNLFWHLRVDKNASKRWRKFRDERNSWKT